MPNIYSAHAQFMRPDDEHFGTIDALVHHLGTYAPPNDHSEHVVPLTALRVHDINGRLSLTDGELNNWSLAQLCGMVGAPARYIADLSRGLAAQALNENIEDAEPKEVKLYTNNNSHTVRAINGPGYGRVYDYHVFKRMLEFKNASSWREPPDWNKQPQGAFYGDQDAYGLLISGGSYVLDDGSPSGLNFGVQVRHSEVGKYTLDQSIVSFRGICGNLIIWDAAYIMRQKMRHTKNAPNRFYQTTEFDTRFLETIPEIGPAIQLLIDNARKCQLIWNSNEKEHVEELQKLASRAAKFSIAEMRSARTKALTEEGDIANLWQLVNGLTATARSLPNYSERADLQARAGKLLSLAA